MAASTYLGAASFKASVPLRKLHFLTGEAMALLLLVTSEARPYPSLSQEEHLTIYEESLVSGVL